MDTLVTYIFSGVIGIGGIIALILTVGLYKIWKEGDLPVSGLLILGPTLLVIAAFLFTAAWSIPSEFKERDLFEEKCNAAGGVVVNEGCVEGIKLND